jgi:hypothetical protein
LLRKTHQSLPLWVVIPIDIRQIHSETAISRKLIEWHKGHDKRAEQPEPIDIERGGDIRSLKRSIGVTRIGGDIDIEKHATGKKQIH